MKKSETFKITLDFGKSKAESKNFILRVRSQKAKVMCIKSIQVAQSNWNARQKVINMRIKKFESKKSLKFWVFHKLNRKLPYRWALVKLIFKRRPTFASCGIKIELECDLNFLEKNFHSEKTADFWEKITNIQLKLFFQTLFLDHMM